MILSHCFFFFSSRRRHTRFDCDWSSDVCSSDLCPGVELAASDLAPESVGTWRKPDRPGQFAHPPIAAAVHQTTQAAKETSQGDARRQYIRCFPKWQALPARVNDESERRADQPPVKYKSTLLD